MCPLPVYNLLTVIYPFYVQLKPVKHVSLQSPRLSPVHPFRPRTDQLDAELRIQAVDRLIRDQRHKAARTVDSMSHDVLL